MSELKTQKTEASVNEFVASISDSNRRADAMELVAIMKQATNCEPKMWGSSIVGFGSYHYKYKSGREGDWLLVGFSPRKQNFSLYVMIGTDDQSELLQGLGSFKTGKSCLYVKRLSDIDQSILIELIKKSVTYLKSVDRMA